MFVVNLSCPKLLNMSEKQLYQKCLKWGARCREARAKFEGLLPLVEKSRLWEKKGFGSIFEFAAKLAGLSHEQVRRVLSLDERLSDRPLLQNAIRQGEISVNKMARIVSIATPENQQELLETAKNLSKSALETFVRDQKSVPGHAHSETTSREVKLHEDVRERLNDLQNKGIDINELIREALDKRDQEIAEAYVETPAKSRYVPAPVKRAIKKEHGTKCSVPGCSRPSCTLHHTRRFALTKSHNPAYIAPLCKAHHEIAHKIDHTYRVRAG